MSLNEAEKLRGLGFATKKASVTRVRISDDIHVPTEGPIAHPRWALPLDEPMIAHIMLKGMEAATTGEPWCALVRHNKVKDQDVLELINTARRIKNGREAERRLRESAPRKAPLVCKDKDDPSDLGSLWINVEVFHGSDAEALKARLAANSEPGKLPDSAEVLAITVEQLAAAGCHEPSEIVPFMPAGVGRKEVLALAAWRDLTPEGHDLFVSSNAPVGILAAVLAAGRDQQLPTLQRLLAEGVRTGTGATRKLNAEREARTGEPTKDKGKRWTPRRFMACAYILGKAVMPDGDPVDLAEEAFTDGWAACCKFAAGEKTGRLPKRVSKAIKAVTAAKKGGAK